MKLVILAGQGESTDIVFHKLEEQFGVDAIILEQDVPMKQFLKRRIKKLGLGTVIGQMLFMTLVTPIQRRLSRRRINEIYSRYDFNGNRDYQSSPQCKKVKSANDEECIRLLQQIHPDIVVVNGTRILSKKVLECCDSVFINMHVGITPKYRGVHGGYWALYKGDPEHMGVTVHLVDTGIDTGKVIGQALIQPTKKDNFSTYPYLQVGEGIPLEIEAIQQITQGGLELKDVDLPSAIYSHPTIFQYIGGYIRRGVK